MPTPPAIESDATEGAAAWARFDVAESMSIADAGASLGVAEASVVALANAGLLEWRAPGAIFRRSVDDLAERLWRAALGTASDAPGARLCEAVEAAGVGPAIWPEVVVALLDGRLNAFRRRGVFGVPILAALVVSSEHVVAELVGASECAGEAPFIWTPTPRQRRNVS